MYCAIPNSTNRIFFEQYEKHERVFITERDSKLCGAGAGKMDIDPA